MAYEFFAIALITAWLAAPLALRLWARQSDLPPPSTVLTGLAALLCAAMLAMGDGLTGPAFLAPPDRLLHDTYYVLAATQYLKQLAFLLLGVGGVALVAQGVALAARSPQARRLAAVGHWAVHLGIGGLILLLGPSLPMPRSFADFPAAARWHEVAVALSSMLTFAGMLVILGTAIFAGLALMRRR